MVCCQKLAGEWEADVLGLGCFQVALPGTLDTNGVGGADKPHLRTRFTRTHTFEGTVRYRRAVALPVLSSGERLFLRIERTREAALFVDGRAVAAYEAGSLSTPYLYELTAFAHNAESRTVELCIQVDNRYTAFPRESLINSSAATDETQTNWNGILGDFALYTAPAAFIRALRVYPKGNATLDVQVEADGVDAAAFLRGKAALRIESAALLAPVTAAEAERIVPLEDGRGVLVAFRALALKASCARWDLGEGNLHELTAMLTVRGSADARTVTFGIRSFTVGADARLLINGRRFFLRGEANCAVFPETGHPPLTVAEWRTVLESYRAYGVNTMRFHSWCPPDAAFTAADQLGILMQPELSQWNFSNAFGNEKARAYYKHELAAILRALANHPSFVMLTFGNELQYTDEGESHSKHLLSLARRIDPTRLYAKSSNYHYGALGVDDESDFYTAAKIRSGKLRAIGSPMRGHLNERVPCSTTDYSASLAEAHEKGKPVFGFEVGQYEVLPDESELALFKGVTEPVNYQQVQDEVTEKGFRARWNDYAAATGELALICYREEVEATLRTLGMSGLSLLGLQDFPGQGTALVGMMNAHLQPKPFAFAAPERFRAFFADVLPLLYLARYTYRAGEELTAGAKLAYYAREPLAATPLFELYAGDDCIYRAELAEARIDGTGLFTLGDVRLTLPACADRRALRLDAVLRVGRHENRYPLWVYPQRAPVAVSAEYAAEAHSSAACDGNAVSANDGCAVYEAREKAAIAASAAAGAEPAETHGNATTAAPCVESGTAAAEAHSSAACGDNATGANDGCAMCEAREKAAIAVSAAAGAEPTEAHSNATTTAPCVESDTAATEARSSAACGGNAANANDGSAVCEEREKAAIAASAAVGAEPAETPATRGDATATAPCAKSGTAATEARSSAACGGSATGANTSPLITQVLTERVLSAVEHGATAFFEPPCTAEAIPASVESHFSTDFWSVGTFPVQSGTMGLFIDAAHPALSGFPTETHTNYQWWRMAKSRAMLLPAHITPIVAVPDCIDRLRHLCVLFEARYGSGRLLVSSMGLLAKQDAPECAELLHSLLAYTAAAPATPTTNVITRAELEQLFGRIV